jgi:hypothetical protein
MGGVMPIEILKSYIQITFGVFLASVCIMAVLSGIALLIKFAIDSYKKTERYQINSHFKGWQYWDRINVYFGESDKPEFVNNLIDIKKDGSVHLNAVVGKIYPWYNEGWFLSPYEGKENLYRLENLDLIERRKTNSIKSQSILKKNISLKLHSFIE